MQIQHVTHVGSVPRFKRIALLGALLLTAMTAYMWNASQAEAGFYQTQPYCPAGYTQQWSSWQVLDPGQRCVGSLHIRAKLMSGFVTNGYGEEFCIVGKHNADGSGGNDYPATCGIGFKITGLPGNGCQCGGWLIGTNVPEGSAPTWPTIINRGIYQHDYEGYWEGWFP